MNCKKCGFELKENWIICPNCSTKINNNVSINNQQNVKNEKEEKVYLITFLISIPFLFIEQISALAFLVALITIVTAFIKFPNNRSFKVLFWIFISIVAIIMFFIMISLFFCMNAVSQCG